MLLSEIKFLVLKDIKLEFKQRYAINGILLYVVSTIFVSYLSFAKIIDPATWNSLFWIIMPFVYKCFVAWKFWICVFTYNDIGHCVANKQ